ncbi:MAG: hypothetical protein Kow00108_16700 [Calditrichia bacterium]
MSSIHKPVPDLLTIKSFLNSNSLVLMGFSRRKNHFSREIYNQLNQRKINVYPVNPNRNEDESVRVYRSLHELPQPPESVLFLTSPANMEPVLLEILSFKPKMLWFVNKKQYDSLPEYLKDQISDTSITLIVGYCPLMFLENTAWPHRFHGKILRWLGRYPTS